eukprot:scaffold1698_cov201-Alexandrium_tamarense.AAC.11
MTYPYLLHSSVSETQECSEVCDSTNQGEKEREFYRGFAYVKKNVELYGAGDCFCFYDSGRLPTFSDDVDVEASWSRNESGEAEGDISAGSGVVGVDCFKVLLKEVVSSTVSCSRFLPFREEQCSL